MAHFAFVDDQNVVQEVIAGHDETTGDCDWESYYAAVRGQRCLRTSYNTRAGVHENGGVPFRGNYAAPGYAYLQDIDAFVPPCPGEDYELNPTTFSWIAKGAA
jgi:hypothetical protein